MIDFLMPFSTTGFHPVSEKWHRFKKSGYFIFVIIAGNNDIIKNIFMIDFLMPFSTTGFHPVLYLSVQKNISVIVFCCKQAVNHHAAVAAAEIRRTNAELRRKNT